MFVPQSYDIPLWRYIAFCTHPSNEFVTKVTDNPASLSLRMPSETRIEQIGTLYLSIALRIGFKTQTLSLGLEYQSTPPCSIVFIYCSILFIYCYSAVTGLHPKRAYYPIPMCYIYGIIYAHARMPYTSYTPISPCTHYQYTNTISLHIISTPIPSAYQYLQPTYYQYTNATINLHIFALYMYMYVPPRVPPRYFSLSLKKHAK